MSLDLSKPVIGVATINRMCRDFTYAIQRSNEFDDHQVFNKCLLKVEDQMWFTVMGWVARISEAHPKMDFIDEDESEDSKLERTH